MTTALKKIYVSPSDQVNNTYAAGGTTEAIQCRQIAVHLVQSLARQNFAALTNTVADMRSRVQESNDWEADLHVCVHTNAHNEKVSGTRLFCYAPGSEGEKACKCVMARLAPITPGTSDGISARPELYECRATHAPTVYVEVDFHDVDEVALWIINNTEKIAEAICQGICDYFGVKYTLESPDADIRAVFHAFMKDYISELKDNDSGKWSREAREWAIANGIIQGIGKGPDGKPNYAWEAPVTREQFVTMLYRALNK